MSLINRPVYTCLYEPSCFAWDSFYGGGLVPFGFFFTAGPTVRHFVVTSRPCERARVCLLPPGDPVYGSAVNWTDTVYFHFPLPQRVVDLVVTSFPCWYFRGRKGQYYYFMSLVKSNVVVTQRRWSCATGLP